MPNIGLMYALSAGADSIRTFDQSASSSSARSIGSAVVTPWPISERSTTTSTLSSAPIRSHALGANGAGAASGPRPAAGRWKPMTRPAPATVAVWRNSRRETSVRELISRPLRVEVDGAGAALGDAAAELGAGETERITQHPQERRVGRDVDRFAFAVDGESDSGHDRTSSRKYGKNV